MWRRIEEIQGVCTVHKFTLWCVITCTVPIVCDVYVFTQKMREKITCVCVCRVYWCTVLLQEAEAIANCVHCVTNVFCSRTHARTCARAHSHTHIVDNWSLKEVENKNLDDINIIDHNDDKLHNISGLQKNVRKHFRAVYIPYNVTEKVLSQFILFGM